MLKSTESILVSRAHFLLIFLLKPSPNRVPSKRCVHCPLGVSVQGTESQLPVSIPDSQTLTPVGQVGQTSHVGMTYEHVGIYVHLPCSKSFQPVTNHNHASPCCVPFPRRSNHLLCSQQMEVILINLCVFSGFAKI